MIWILFVSASLLAVYSLFNIFVGYGSMRWPHVLGRIKRSRVVINGHMTPGSSYRYFHPAVVYEYEVGNRKFTNNRIGNYLGFGNDEALATEITHRYAEGDEVKVYYWPAFPNVALLSPGMKQALGNYVLLLTGVLLMLGSFPALFTDDPYWFVEKIFGIVEYIR
jgi:hypothetical protein